MEDPAGRFADPLGKVIIAAAGGIKAYPRPQLERTGWANLKGLWSYVITAKSAAAPSNFDGEILAPFPVESALLGVEKVLIVDF